MRKDEFADLIIKKLESSDLNILKKNYKNSSSINFLVIDNFLPHKIACMIDKEFPKKENMNLRSELQEKKYISVNWNSKNDIVENCLYAFQDEKVISTFSKICGIEDLSGDPEIYRGGLSFMDKGCFLNPHIDNSHDRLRERYRRLNLLYYVSKDFVSEKDGGELVLFPNGIKSKQILIQCKFNTLVVMRTDNKSLHGVNKINSKDSGRKCISNYYFSYSSPLNGNYYHSTSFRGFKGEKTKDLILRMNASLRTFIRSNTGNLFEKYINRDHFRKGKF